MCRVDVVNKMPLLAAPHNATNYSHINSACVKPDKSMPHAPLIMRKKACCQWHSAQLPRHVWAISLVERKKVGNMPEKISTTVDSLNILPPCPTRFSPAGVTLNHPRILPRHRIVVARSQCVLGFFSAATSSTILHVWLRSAPTCGSEMRAATVPTPGLSFFIIFNHAGTLRQASLCHKIVTPLYGM